jgi:hypothetical protein
MPQGMSGNDWHPRALAGEPEACVERLVAKGRAVTARKDERRSREVDFPGAVDIYRVQSGQISDN